jgi:hypothetical protein
MRSEQGGRWVRAVLMSGLWLAMLGAAGCGDTNVRPNVPLQDIHLQRVANAALYSRPAGTPAEFESVFLAHKEAILSPLAPYFVDFQGQTCPDMLILVCGRPVAGNPDTICFQVSGQGTWRGPETLGLAIDLEQDDVWEGQVLWSLSQCRIVESRDASGHHGAVPREAVEKAKTIAADFDKTFAGCCDAEWIAAWCANGVLCALPTVNPIGVACPYRQPACRNLVVLTFAVPGTEDLNTDQVSIIDVYVDTQAGRVVGVFRNEETASTPARSAGATELQA